MTSNKSHIHPSSMAVEPVPRLVISFAGGWRFRTDPEDIGLEAGWQAADFNAENWEKVTIPHSWNTNDAYTSYEGIAWYQLSFECPIQTKYASIRLKFDAVFYLACIYLNGEYLGEHEGGYTPFEFEINPFVHLGGGNILTVRVDNRRAINRLPAHLFEGRSYGWNNYGGIVRDVSLILTSKTYIEKERLVARAHITGLDQADQASLSAKVFIQNSSNEEFNGEVVVEVQEEKIQQVVNTSTRSIQISAGKATDISLDVILPNPKLWHFDHPHLYVCVIGMKNYSGIEFDRKTCLFGVREIEWRNGELRLNGEPVRLSGLSRHANVPGFGLAETEPVMTSDFNDLKTLNMVLGRPVHYPQHEFIYDYCDHNGILLIPELPAWQLTAGQMADEGLRALAKQQLAEMVAAAWNHPCIWAWSVGNELESDTVAGRAFVRDMVEYVRLLDPTRPVGFASYHLLVGRPWGDATKYSDIVMMNEYFGTWHGPKDCLGAALDTVRHTWPDKVVIVTEFGFSPHWQRIEGPSRIDPTQYYSIPDDVSVDSLEADTLRQQVIEDHMAVFRSRSFVSGTIFWEYRGRMGVVADNGRRRNSWYTIQEEFAPIKIDEVKVEIIGEEYVKINIVLRTRGPIETDLPVYTLRNYRVIWGLVKPPREPLEQQGEESLPILFPGSIYDLSIEIPAPKKNQKLRVTIIRPTGFVVISKDISL